MSITRLSRQSAHATTMGTQWKYCLQHSELPWMLSLRNCACTTARTSGYDPLHGKSGRCTFEQRVHLAHIWPKHQREDPEAVLGFVETKRRVQEVNVLGIPHTHRYLHPRHQRLSPISASPLSSLPCCCCAWSNCITLRAFGITRPSGSYTTCPPPKTPQERRPRHCRLFTRQSRRQCLQLVRQVIGRRFT